jgi:TorA maturation chaperone TorD
MQHPSPKIVSRLMCETIDDTDEARAREYALLSVLLRRPPDARLLADLAGISDDSSPLGSAHRTLADAAAEATEALVEREYFNLFVGTGRGELLPYGSYYMSGFLNERPLARLRDDLLGLGIVRAEHELEPEDHAAILCEIMAGLIERRFDCPINADRTLFERHVEPWMGRLFTDLEKANNAKFYKSVGMIGRIFIDIEREGYECLKS